MTTKQPDWEAIERAYRAGLLSLRAIASEHGVAHNTIMKRAEKEGWQRDLNNLYFITDKQGKKTRFRMTDEQIEYFDGMHTRNIILKARQLGFTTECCIIQLDAALFESAKCALIAHTLNDAKRLFREKVKYAYDNLPKEIRAANPASNDAAGELVFSKGGSLYVSTSFRGGTLRYLHVSEFGKIYPRGMAGELKRNFDDHSSVHATERRRPALALDPLSISRQREQRHQHR